MFFVNGSVSCVDWHVNQNLQLLNNPDFTCHLCVFGRIPRPVSVGITRIWYVCGVYV